MAFKVRAVFIKQYQLYSDAYFVHDIVHVRHE